ncbi:HD domain-containing phosphohydrolase [Acidisphaera sp. S103]|uniref:response regulator n=1 Tax=Acidisphaera sp. S103 TaxID=1747223 RepID=UPI0020B1395A|nr:HD domain-containing phosphohydrolase [Acidisphaera sp. S103]
MTRNALLRNLPNYNHKENKAGHVRGFALLWAPIATHEPTIQETSSGMDAQKPDRTGKPYIAIAVGNGVLRSRVTNCLMSFYRFVEYPDISQAIAGCRTHVPRLALVSEELSMNTGCDFVRMLRNDPNLKTVPVVMVVDTDDEATRDRVVRCGAESFIVDPYPRSTLINMISGLLNRRVEDKWQTLQLPQRQALTNTLNLFNGIANGIGNGEPIPYQAVSEACQPLVEAVGNDDFVDILKGVRNHDNYTYAHSMRVATYLALFGFNLRLPKNEQVILASGGLLHDVGKMSIPHEVLNKPGRLNVAEFEVMKGHVAASVTYLQGCPDLPKGIGIIASQHHEKLDGTGYPLGLAGNKLNRLARMASIIDVFTALTDRRVYKREMAAETALKLMADDMTSHLDMKLLGLFRQMLLDATRAVPRRDD